MQPPNPQEYEQECPYALMTDNEDRNTLDYDCCNAPVERAIRAEHPPRLPVFLIFGAVVLLYCQVCM